mgnify:CR=1
MVVQDRRASKTQSIGRLRRMVWEMLKEELGEIDGLVRRLLAEASREAG